MWVRLLINTITFLKLQIIFKADFAIHFMDTRFKIYKFSDFKHISFLAYGSYIRISSVYYTISCYI